jgi:hypothetical protein
MNLRLALCALSVALVACGDNSNECDPGTTRNENGVCVGTLTCAEGTIATADGKCEIDPNACQGGTVLVGGACVDPGVAKADLEEGAEPNGLGLFEQSADPAGIIMLKAEGEHFVIHGKIAPFRDADGDGQDDVDVDTYALEVTGPTLLTITADGTNGLAAGFVSVANVPATNPLTDWVRFGVNLNGDTSKRQLYLPVAGIYLIGIGDSRTLFLSGAAAGAAAGKPAFEYYVTVDKTATPTPTALTVTAGVATSTGMRAPGEVKLFSVQMGLGVNNATLESGAPQVQTSVAIVNTRGTTTKILGIADADNSVPEPASVGAVGIKTGDITLVVADSVIDYANSPTDYELTISAGSAGALPTNNMPVSQPASATDFSTFFYDVAPDALLIGLNISFNKPVTGVVVDENFFIFSLFTFDPDFGFAFGDTFQSYKGLIRHAAPGRYYFLVFDGTFTPTSPAANLTATSAYGAVTPGQVTKGTPLTAQAINVYESNPYTYMPGIATDPWQVFNAIGTGSGTVTLNYYNPSPTTVIGRLDTLTNTCGTFCNDSPVPVFITTHAVGGQARPRILLDVAAQTSWLVTVNTATVTPAPTFDLSFAAQANVTDLGTVAVGTPIASNNKPLNATTATIQRFLVRATIGNNLTITASPDVAAIDTRIQRVNIDETANGAAVNNGVAGAVDTAIAAQGTNGWTAYTVDKTAGPDGTFDTTVTSAAPVTYTTAAGTTAFSDACVGGTQLVFTADGDEGVTPVIATPAGFDFFGFAAPSLKVFANGFVSFDTSTVCASATSCFFLNADLPTLTAPNSIAAPYWDDIVLTGAAGGCQKTVGTKLIIQWSGTLFNVTPTQSVQMQLIIDGSNDKLEFVYGAGHTVTGSSGTVGIENQTGTAAKKLSFNIATAAAPTLFTPM